MGGDLGYMDSQKGFFFGIFTKAGQNLKGYGLMENSLRIVLFVVYEVCA
jgi:hypothetical protein